MSNSTPPPFRYLSLAILCHPIHRDRFILLSRQSQTDEPPLLSLSKANAWKSFPQDISLETMLENLFPNLHQELSSWNTDENGSDDNSELKLIADFMEQAISMAMSFM